MRMARWSQKIRAPKRAEGVPSGDLFRRDDNVVIYRFLGIIDLIAIFCVAASKTLLRSLAMWLLFTPLMA